MLIRVILFLFFFISISCDNKYDEIKTTQYDSLINFINSFDEYSFDENHSSSYIYNQDKLHRFDIYLTDENLNKIDNDPAAEEYVNGFLIFEGMVIKNVGVRYKGSIGAWVGCLSDPDWTEPNGYKICPKLSMKIKINWKEDKKFYGMKKIQFHSQNLDKSKMRERLGYYMYRNFGINAPRSNHALVYINGEFIGLFANTENIDGPYTNKHFDGGGGNLYKEVWPVSSNGELRSDEYFKYGLKTNEEISNVSKIKSFSNLLSESNKDEVKSVVENWIDKDIFLKTILVDRRIANDDGFMHFYHEGGDTYENHNFYWYEFPNENKLQLIPWDLDNAFENLIQNVNPVTPIKDKWYEISNNCVGFKFGQFKLKQRSAACDKIIGAFTDYRLKYDSLDQIFQNELYNMPNINLLIDKWSLQIKDAVDDAYIRHGNPEPSIKEWQYNIDIMKSSIAQSLN
tara:strand:+ start:442 stop:1809 length:1368 start_codon:yes stop_codon:yes gene_type:complete